MTLTEIKERLTLKASQSICKYKVAALGLNRRGEIIAISANRPRMSRKGGGLHAEMSVMLRAGPALRKILICRVNDQGDIRPIHPCDACADKALELGVTIVTLE
jgi:hypothetical protein